MIPQGFIDYHTMRDSRIQTLLEQVRGFCTVDGIHDLRVEMKRLRAFYYLIDRIDRGLHARRHLESVERLFKATGPLRDLHVQMAATRQWTAEHGGNLSEYYNSLVMREKRRRSQCGTALRRFNHRSIPAGLPAIRKALGKYVEPEVVYRAEQRLSVLLRELLNCAGGRAMSEKALHEIRIRTKEARYVLEVLSQCRFGSEQDTELNKGLLECHRSLGKWHDCIVLAGNVQKYLNDRPDDFFFDRQSYTGLVESLTEQRDHHLGEFQRHWHDYRELFKAFSEKVDAF